jgi:hypothetical protein
MNEAPHYLAEEHEAAIEAAANVLRAYAQKHKMPCASSLSVDELRPAVHRIAERFFTASFFEQNHSDQIGARDAKKAVQPALTALEGLRVRLEKIGDERWRDWAWIASSIYANSADVQEELSTRNEQAQNSIRNTDEDFADHVVGAIDLVWDDISALKATVERVERRWQSVNDALSGGAIAAPPSAFHSLVNELYQEWQRQIGSAPPMPMVHEDKHGKDKGGPFVNFAKAVLSACSIKVESEQFGYRIANALTANAKSSSKVA